MELLAPAGNFEKFLTAIHFGADAVYMAGGKYGLRAFAGNFDENEMRKAVEIAHEKGRKVYVTLNIIARDEDFEELPTYLQFLQESFHKQGFVLFSLTFPRLLFCNTKLCI